MATATNTIDTLDVTGKKSGTIELPAELFDVQTNVPLIHQVVVAQLAAARQGTHKTKTRGEVSGAGRKPFKQKGTGRARQGSIRAPQMTGGGVVHGPQPGYYSQRTPKKMKRLALRSALSARAAESAIKVVDDIDWSGPKTKQALKLLGAIEATGKTLVVLSQLDGSAGKSFRNLADVRMVEPGHLTAYDVLWSDQVVFTSHTVGSVGRSSKYEVSQSDFVKESAAGDGGEEE
jgi:large subunit ribosomal protein L4